MLNIKLIIGLISLFVFTNGDAFRNILPLVSSINSVGLNQPVGQNISVPGYATSSFSFGGLVFVTVFESDSSTALMAFTNDTLDLIQTEVLPDYPCFNPQYSLSSYDSTAFILQCSSAPNISGIPVVWVIKNVQGLFFRIIISDWISGYTDDNWAWLPSSLNLWNMDTTGIGYITYSLNNIYYGQLVYSFNSWVNDLQGFTWTNITMLSKSPVLALCGFFQGVDVLAVASSSGSYQLVRGNFNGVNVLYNSGSTVIGWTTSPMANGGTTLSLWDFSKLTSAKPTLINSLTFNSEITIINNAIPTEGDVLGTFFVTQSFANGVFNVTQVTWSVKGLSQQFFYNGGYAVGAYADSQYFYLNFYGYTTRYPY